MIMVMVVLAACLIQIPKTDAPTDSANSPSTFLLRLTIWGSILFLFWLRMNGKYVYLGDQVVYWLLGRFGIRIHFTYRHAIYYQTFNLVIFAALILAVRKVPISGKAAVSITGLILIMGLHIVFRLMNAWICLQPDTTAAAYKASQIAFLMGEYLIPIGTAIYLLQFSKTDDHDDQAI